MLHGLEVEVDYHVEKFVVDHLYKNTALVAEIRSHPRLEQVLRRPGDIGVQDLSDEALVWRLVSNYVDTHQL